MPIQEDFPEKVIRKIHGVMRKCKAKHDFMVSQQTGSLRKVIFSVNRYLVDNGQQVCNLNFGPGGNMTDNLPPKQI